MKHRLIAGRNPGPWTGEGTNTYFIPGAVPTLIDVAVGAPEMLDEVAACLGAAVSPGAPLQVLATHGHSDHVQGAGPLRARFGDATFAKFPWPDVDGTSDIPWRPLKDDAVVAAGEGHLWALHTPGHSPDHVCFYDPRTAVVFAGDLVRNGGTVVIPGSRGGHLTSYLTSLRRLLELSPRRLLPGHGGPVENPSALLRSYLAHRQQREQQVVDVLRRAPATPDEIVVAIYQHLDEDVRLVARESVLAHLVRLAELGHARADDQRWSLV